MARDFLLVSKEKRVAFDGRNFRGKNGLTPELGNDPNCLRQTGLMTLATTYFSSTHNTRRLKWSGFQIMKDHIFLFSAQSLGKRSLTLLRTRTHGPQDSCRPLEPQQSSVKSLENINQESSQTPGQMRLLRLLRLDYLRKIKPGSG